MFSFHNGKQTNPQRQTNKNKKRKEKIVENESLIWDLINANVSEKCLRITEKVIFDKSSWRRVSTGKKINFQSYNFFDSRRALKESAADHIFKIVILMTRVKAE